jgi:hypothetical protein
LRIVFGLSIDIKVHFIDAGLPFGTQFGVPSTTAQPYVAEFVHSQAAPDTATLWCQRLDTVAPSSELIAEDIASA